MRWSSPQYTTLTPMSSPRRELILLGLIGSFETLVDRFAESHGRVADYSRQTVNHIHILLIEIVWLSFVGGCGGG